MERLPGVHPRALLLGLCFSLVFWAVVASCVFATQAVADPVIYEPPADKVVEPESPEGQPECPTPPEPFEGEDVTAAEVRLLRAEAVEACLALSARLDRVRERLWWVVAEGVDAGSDRDKTNEKLQAILDQDCSNPCEVFFEGQSKPVEIDTGEALAVEDTGSAALVESVDASGEALKSGLYFIAGIVVAGLVCYVIYRQVMPRA